MNSCRTRICVAALLALSSIVLPAASHAQTALSDAQTLLAQGQRTQALEKVERAIAANPKDRQARFLKGVILAELNKLDDAAAVFLKLTEEAPELPEPYNNLAVIYAQQQQFDKAKAALEMAIRTHPSYAVAHENLGDLYARMARQAYDRALQIDSKNTNAQAKLNLLRELNTAAARPAAVKPVTVATTAPVSSQGSVEVRPVTATQAPAASSSSVASSSAAAARSSSSPAVVAAASAASASSAESSRGKPAKEPAAPDGRKAVVTAVNAWADAWSAKNVKAYLGFYARDFAVPGKKGRSAWEKERTERIEKPGAIKVSLSEIDVRVNGDKATVRFKQNYQSAGFNSASGKTLELALQNGRWLITQERIGR
ncbi:tetratricopeptide repeat protein [Uliginosibacterium paludis]|uniref:Tetratricopeptide repeat protein n=1 Tax=Uliginosibacterium paludis TaxID=1615952 RepID=A0ABV2CKQ9_9RHOO